MIKNAKYPARATVELSRAIGKSVTSKDNKKLGKLKAVYIRPGKIEIGGIRLGPSRLLADVIDARYISSISEKGVVLTLSPITEYRGMKVVDSAKEAIGTIEKVNRKKKTGEITSFIVSRGLLKSDVTLKKSDVEKVTGKVYLNRKV